MNSTRSNRDLELLLAVTSGDSVKYQWQLEKLTQYADSLALTMFPSPALQHDAVEKAMNDVEDWLNPSDILKADHPWAFAKKTIYYSLIDSTRTQKLEEVDITSVRDTIDKQILRWTDDEIRKEFVKAADDVEADDYGSGWREFQIISEGQPRRTDDDSYHPHRNIEALWALFQYKWWWSLRKWEQNIKSNRRKAMQSLKWAYEEANLRYAEYTRKLWSNYNLITARINNIQRPSESRIMRAFLAGLKQVEISRDMNVSKPFVSRVVNNYIKEWEWGDSDIYKARLILLTQHLAVLYRNFSNDLEKAVKKYWAGKPVMERYTISPPAGAELFGGKSIIAPFPPDLKTRERKELSHIGAYHEEKNLFSKVVNSIGTKAYFSDLEKGDMIALNDTCDLFYRRWYGVFH